MSKYFIEIKNRILFTVCCFISSLLVSYYYKETLVFLYTEPCFLLTKGQMFSYFICTDFIEAFQVYLDVIGFTSFQILTIFVFYQGFLFIVRSLFIIEYHYLKNFFILCIFVWFFSLVFLKYFVLPFSSEFFFNFHETSYLELHFEAKLRSYVSFSLETSGLVIVYFQVFCFLLYVTTIKTIHVCKLKMFRKFYYFGFIIFSTVITPPDVISQMLLIISLILIYEASYIYLVFIQKIDLIW